MAYRTEDGQKFDNEYDAQRHANHIEAGRQAEMNATNRSNQKHYANRVNAVNCYNQMVRLYNDGDWEGAYNIYKENKSHLEFHRAWYSDLEIVVSRIKEKMWEKEKGSPLTEAEKCEKEIVDCIGRYFGSYIWTLARRWEKATGRKMTKQEQIRIAGRLFPADIDGFDNSPSSSSTSDGTSVIVKILGAVIGAVLGGILLKFLIPSLWIAIIVGGAAGWYLGSTLKKKFVVIGIIAVVVLLFGKSIIGLIGNKTPKAQSTQTITVTKQADIIKDVNFRKDHSTESEIIRQLKKGDMVTLTGEVSGGWTQITHNGDTGWVSTEFLKIYGK